MSEPTENPAHQFQIDVLARLSALQASIAETSETLQASIAETSATLRASIAETSETLRASIAETSETFNSQVSGIQSQVSGIQSQVSGIQSTQAELTSRVESLRSELSEFNTSINDTVGQVRSDQARLRVEIMARIDRLQATVDLVREDGRVNWATADTALNRVKHHREEMDNLTAMISAMERRYQTLSSIVDGLRDPDARKSNGS